MATSKQTSAARRNVKKAQRAASDKRTIANLPARNRSELGKQAARGRRRGARPVMLSRTATASSSTTSPARKASSGGRRWASWELIDAIRASR